MKKSLLTNIGILIKRITGIKDISLLRKNIRKYIGKRIYTKKYTADDIVRVMKELGMKEGSVVCIHSAMKEFYNYCGTANELINAILDVITPMGTLIMPAFPDPKLKNSPDYIFNPLTDPTKAGYLAETFRKYPGVKRSINVQHSVCALGKEAEYLVKDHHKCINCWDENSPWYRMCELDALVFNLGLPRFYIGTFDHCVEGILYKEHPYWAQFFTMRKLYKYYDERGECKSYECMEGSVEMRTRERNLTKHFDKSMFRIKRISNLEIKVFNSKACLEKMIELGRRGITMYYVPSPKKYKF